MSAGYDPSSAAVLAWATAQAAAYRLEKLAGDDQNVKLIGDEVTSALLKLISAVKRTLAAERAGRAIVAKAVGAVSREGA